MMKPNIKSGCLIAIGCISLVIITLYFLVFQSKPRIEIGLARVPWLPVAASNINIYERSGFAWIKLYEGQLPEADFREYAASNGWKMTSTTNEPVSWRKVFGLRPLRTIEDIGNIDLVPNALTYSDRQPNGGGITVVYDLEFHQLHVLQSHR